MRLKNIAAFLTPFIFGFTIFFLEEKVRKEKKINNVVQKMADFVPLNTLCQGL